MRFQIDMSVKLKYYQFKLVIVLVDGGTSHLKMIVCLVRKPVKLHANHENTPLKTKLSLFYACLSTSSFINQSHCNQVIVEYDPVLGETTSLLGAFLCIERRDSRHYFVGGKLLCMMRTFRIQKAKPKINFTMI